MEKLLRNLTLVVRLLTVRGRNKAGRQPLIGSFCFAVALIFILSSCAGSLHTSAVGVDVRVSSPGLGFNHGVGVVYPSQYIVRGQGDQLVGRYGPSWKNLQALYPEYNFNP